MIRSILRAVAGAVRYVAGNLYAGVMNVLYPGLLDNTAAGAADAESDVQSDMFEHYADAEAEREIALNDTLSWALQRLTAGAPSPFPDSLSDDVCRWLSARSDSELEAIAVTPPNDLYGHLFFGLQAQGLPSFKDERPAPEAPAVRYAPGPECGSGGLLHHARCEPAPRFFSM